jgi:hypothetical protein
MELLFLIPLAIAFVSLFFDPHRDSDFARREKEMDELQKEQKERHARYAAKRKEKGMGWIDGGEE